MTDSWTKQIDTITEAFKTQFGTLSQEQLNWKPDAQSWSIAQVMDHLITVNGTYYPLIESVRKGTYKLPFLGKLGFMVNFFGKMILGSVQPDRKRKTKTFPIWEPAQSTVEAGILDKFIESQSHLRQLIISCSDLLDQNTIISSPANRNIVYKLETAFDIIVAHEKRHFEQAKEVLGLYKPQ